MIRLLSLVFLLVWAGTAAAADLDQRIDRGQGVATDRAVLATGHVDVGPRFLDGRWTLMVHDDGEGSSVWRPTDRTVLRVGDAARRRAPDDPAYDFLPAAPGGDLWVVPQTQDPGVVWLGWNTQDPRVMETIDRGVRLTLLDVQGPGSLVVYLQSGDFGAPRVLWDSRAAARPIWIDVNTHTHANWVFSRPGVHLVRVQVEAELIDGSTVSDTRELRFAVGDGTPVAEAFAARPEGTAAGGAEAGRSAVDGDRAARSDDDAGGGGSAVPIAAIAIVALGLVAALTLVVVRGGRAKRRARERT